MGIFGNKKSRGSIVGNYNTIKTTPQKKSKIQDEFDTFGGTQYKGDLMGQYDDNVTTTTTTVTKTEYIDTKTGQVKRTTTTTKKKSSSRASSLVSSSRTNSIVQGKKPVDGRTNSITNKKKYRYVSSSTGLKMVEITPEEEELEKARQEKLIRRSNSHVSLRPSSMYTPQKRQSSIVRNNSITQNRQSSLNNEISNSARKNWAKIERASSGLAAAQIVTGNKETKQLTNNDLKQRKSILNMKSTVNSPNKVVSKIGTSEIKEESPIVESKPKENATKTVKRVPSMRNGLVANKTPVKKDIAEPSNSLTKNVKKEVKITPMKVKVKPSLSNLKEKDENFLKFQKQAEKNDYDPANPQTVTTPAFDEKADVKPVAVTTEETIVVAPILEEKVDEVKQESSEDSTSNTEVPVLKEEDVVPQQEILDDAKPEKVPEVNIPIHKEEDIVEPLDEKSKEVVTEPVETSFVYDQPPVIELDKSEDQNTTPSKKLSNSKNFGSSESVFYSANEDDADDVILEPIINKEKPLKSAIRTKSKYSTPSETSAPKKTNEAYVKLTTAENTRLNSQLQDENQRKSKIVRSPSKRMSMKINPAVSHPTALSKGSLRGSTNENKNTLKKGKMKMSERMNNPTPMTTSKARTKPNMNVTLEEPELTPLEKKSSFERERGETKKTMGFGMMSMRHDLGDENEESGHHQYAETVPKFKSRFADSDDEYEEEIYKPKVPATAGKGSKMMVESGKHTKTMRPEKSKKIVKPEEKKGLGTKLKKIFSKSKKK